MLNKSWDSQNSYFFMYKQFLLYPILCGFCGLLLVSCGGNSASKTESEKEFKGDTVIVNAKSAICSKIKLVDVQKSDFCNEFRTVGTVQAENGCYAEVSTPFDGRVTRLYVHLGSKVSAGQCLYEISSPDFVEVSKGYFQAERNYETIQKSYARKKSLFDHGIIAQKELDEISTEMANAKKELESAEATLRVFNMSPQNLKMGQNLRVCAPIAGEVVSNDVTVGQFVKADDAPMLKIADLRKVWVSAMVKEHYIGIVNKQNHAEIFTEAQPDSIYWGKILNVGNMVDEETRAVQVVMSVDNAKNNLKHGMYVSVHFISNAEPAIVLPASSVFQGEERSYVYVATSKSNTYVRREVDVKTGSDDHKQVCVLSGLEVGEKVVSEGGLFFNE